MISREKILEEYPFLKPYENNPEYLDPDNALMIDSIPEGWNVFIYDMCKDIKQCLIENDCLETYELYQVKEKFGGLRWYDNMKCTNDIIRKYEEISERTCAFCGKPSTHFTNGWIIPLCDECDEGRR